MVDLLRVEDFQANLRVLRGRIVESAKVMLALRGDPPVEDALYLLIKIKAGHWHKALLDTGALFWEETQAPAPADLDARGPAGDAPLELRALPVGGARIAAVTMRQVDDHGVLAVEFEDGRRLILRTLGEGTPGEITLLALEAPAAEAPR